MNLNIVSAKPVKAVATLLTPAFRIQFRCGCQGTYWPNGQHLRHVESMSDLRAEYVPLNFCSSKHFYDLLATSKSHTHNQKVN